MHGPNHLFCAGCNMDDDPLAAAAWAGHLAAKGNHAEAKKWAEEARRRAGRVILQWSSGGNSGDVVVRVIGAEWPSREDMEAVIQSLTLQLDGLRRREERAAKASSTPMPDARTPDAGAPAAQDAPGRTTGGGDETQGG